MTDDQFIDAIESCQYLLSEFSHGAHIRLAWAYLTRKPLPEAMMRFRDSLKSFVAHHGKADLYHETITFAFILIIHDRIHLTTSTTWSSFISRNTDLLERGKEIIDRLYHHETLASAAAKERFFLPDRYRLVERESR